MLYGPSSRKILVVDDDAGFRDNLEDILGLQGFHVITACDFESALIAASLEDPPVVLLDFNLPDGCGPDLIARLKERNADCICIVLTAHADLDAAVSALDQGAYHFLRKPVQPAELLGLLKRSFEILGLREAKRRAEEALTVRNQELERMITEQKRLEAQLIQTQKLEAIGTLAGGVAHDFNNVLAGIIGYIELALMRLHDLPRSGDHETDGFLRKGLEACQRAKHLIEQILAFSHHSEKELQPILIASLLAESIKFLRATLPATITIGHDIKCQNATVMADATQIHRVIMNLCTNAAYAMQAGGMLTVNLHTLSEAAWDKIRLRVRNLPPAPCLRLSVSDTGPGIDPAIRDRIFDPYFTTKSKGEGTGLGLAVVQGVVESCNGAIEVESCLGSGSTFHIYLPLIQDGATSVSESREEGLLHGEERILLVDDEPNLVEIGAQLLARLGYRVTTATCSVKALQMFQEAPDAFDLVITDMTMPEMTGDHLAEALFRIRPDLPVILCTGFSEKITAESAQRLGLRGFIMKPIELRTLAQAIRRALIPAASMHY
jgi:signal transduction histidine kinase